MPDPEEHTLFRYLDSKFDAVDKRLDAMELTWRCVADKGYAAQVKMEGRVDKLENWRSYVTGALAVVALLTTGLVGWAWDAVRAMAAAK